jgi:hypothetical protein
VASHYQVDLETISTGCVVPVGVDDEVAMNCADALLPLPPTSSLRTSWTSSSRTLPRQAALKPEDHRAFVPCMFLMLAFESRDYVINICCLKHLDICKLKCSLFISATVLFCLSAFLGEPWLGRFRLHK